jgi:hypothetical protein
VHGVSYYPLGAQVMTLVLPLGFFILVMTALYFVFTTPHAIPGRRPITGARPVAPEPGTERDLAAATGFPTAPSGGGKAPLTDRATPPVVGAARGEETDEPEVASDEAAFGGGAESDKPGPTTSSEDPE